MTRLVSGSLPRLLAITPPDGPLATAPLDVWRDMGVQPGEIAVLLRTPGATPSAIWTRSAALVERCATEGYALWMSVDVGHLDSLDPRWPLRGVLVRGDPGPAAWPEVRRAVGTRLVGRSAHGEPAPLEPAPACSTYAPVFAPRTDQGFEKPAVGVAALERFCAGVPEPVFALGGVAADTVDACFSAGAWGVASIRAFFGPPRTVVHDVDALLRAARAAHGFSSPP